MSESGSCLGMKNSVKMYSNHFLSYVFISTVKKLICHLLVHLVIPPARQTSQYLILHFIKKNNGETTYVGQGDSE